MKHSESLAALAPALAAAQGELSPIVKDSVNPHFRSTYVSLDAILAAVRPVLARHGLSVVQGGGTPHTDEAGRALAVTVRTMLLHGSGEWIANDVLMPLAKQDAQGAGAAITYGRRYGLSALLALATEEDDDGNAASARPAARSAAAPAPAKAAPARQAPGPLAADVAAVVGKAQRGQPVADPVCPSCGGGMWDNRREKKNPKSPDWKCKDKACDGVIWPERLRTPSAQAPSGPSGPAFDDVPIFED
jgi:hypothetical protein